MAHGTALTEFRSNTNAVLPCILHLHDRAPESLRGNPHMNHSHPLTESGTESQKDFPCGWLKTLLLFLVVIPSDHELSKRLLSEVFIQPFPSVLDSETASKSNNSKHSSQGQGSANTRGTLSSTVLKKDLASPLRPNVYSCGWHRMAPSGDPWNKSFWQSQNSSQVLRQYPKTHTRTLSLRHFQNILIIC